MRIKLGLVAAVAVIGAVASTAHSDVLVLQSDAPGIARGAQLPDSATLDVPAGKRINLLRPGGQTQSIVGPRRVTVGEISRGEAINEPIWKRALEDLKAESKAPVGAVRGVSR